MSLFYQLEFVTWPCGDSQAVHHFGNGYGINVIEVKYGHRLLFSKYEVCVLKNGEPVEPFEVKKDLSSKQVSNIMEEIKNIN